MAFNIFQDVLIHLLLKFKTKLMKRKFLNYLTLTCSIIIFLCLAYLAMDKIDIANTYIDNQIKNK